MAVTPPPIADVARRAGVSKGLVSFALNGRPGVSLVTRDRILEIARELGYTVEARSLELEDLLGADEAFFTGTAAEITPIREVDGAMIGWGVRGPVTTAIQSAFFDAVNGRDERFMKWLHPVAQAAAA